jgi:UDP-glucose 4-epimerase
MKIVVTGALGHIGSLLIRRIPTAFPDCNILMVDNLSTQRYCSLFNLPASGRYRFIEADILAMDLDRTLSGADAVVHLAGITDATTSFDHKEQVELVNYQATEKVAKACVRADCALLFPSTTSVYGTQAEVIDEECSKAELKPQSPYAESKLKAEELLHAFGEKQGLRFVICRFGTICGVSPGMRFHTAINKFCWQAVMGQQLTVWTTALHQKRPYLDLGDAVASILYLVREAAFERNVYNILTENLTVHAIIQAIEQHIPGIEIGFVDTMIMNELSYDVMNDKFRRLGFNFQGNIPNAIWETIHLLRSANCIGLPS